MTANTQKRIGTGDFTTDNLELLVKLYLQIFCQMRYESASLSAKVPHNIKAKNQKYKFQLQFVRLQVKSPVPILFVRPAILKRNKVNQNFISPMTESVNLIPFILIQHPLSLPRIKQPSPLGTPARYYLSLDQDTIFCYFCQYHLIFLVIFVYFVHFLTCKIP